MMEIDLSYNAFAVIYICILSATFLFYIIRKKETVRIYFMGLFELYLLILVKITMVPFKIIYDDYYYSTVKTYMENKEYIQLVPFQIFVKLIHPDFNILVQVIGNIILFFPMPIFLFFIIKWRKRTVLIVSVLISAGIECIQLIINIITRYPSRMFDVDDIILNSIGAIVGICVCIIISRSKNLNKCFKNLIYLEV